MTNAVIYACSHRKGGNSDLAAELLAHGVQEAGGTAEILSIRDFSVLPCASCGFCDKSTDHRGRKRCILGSKDQAWELFAPMLTAKTVLFASPIYFYHLPSLFKTWIDRSQMFWTARMAGESWIANLPKRKAHTILVAGRPTGDKLFDGARTTLKYFTWNFNLELATPLCFRGVDEPGDLGTQSNFTQQIIELGKQAWTEPL